MDTNKICLLCGGDAKLRQENHPGYQEGSSFSIYGCDSCNTQFSFPLGNEKNIYNLIYENANRIRGYDRYEEYKRGIKKQKYPLQYLAKVEPAYWGVKEGLAKISGSKASLKILEVGCGMGYLTYALRKEGYNIVGLDISQKAIDEAIKNFGPNYLCADVFQYALQHKAKYDIVILTEVIEHVEEPMKFLITLTLMLRGGGDCW